MSGVVYGKMDDVKFARHSPQHERKPKPQQKFAHSMREESLDSSFYGTIDTIRDFQREREKGGIGSPKAPTPNRVVASSASSYSSAAGSGRSSAGTAVDQQPTAYGSIEQVRRKPGAVAPATATATGPASPLQEEDGLHYGAIQQVKRKPSASPTIDIFVAVDAYEAESEKEISFVKGDRLRIITRDPGGWWKGTCLTTQKTGWLPSDFVIPDRSMLPSARPPLSKTLSPATTPAQSYSRASPRRPAVAAAGTGDSGGSSAASTQQASGPPPAAALAAAITGHALPAASKPGVGSGSGSSLQRSTSSPSLSARRKLSRPAAKPKPLPKAPTLHPKHTVSAFRQNAAPKRVSGGGGLLSYGPLAQLTRGPPKLPTDNLRSYGPLTQARPAVSRHVVTATPSPPVSALADALVSPRINLPAKTMAMDAGGASARVPRQPLESGGNYSPLEQVRRPPAAPAGGVACSLGPRRQPPRRDDPRYNLLALDAVANNTGDVGDADDDFVVELLE